MIRRTTLAALSVCSVVSLAIGCGNANDGQGAGGASFAGVPWSTGGNDNTGGGASAGAGGSVGGTGGTGTAGSGGASSDGSGGASSGGAGGMHSGSTGGSSAGGSAGSGGTSSVGSGGTNSGGTSTGGSSGSSTGGSGGSNTGGSGGSSSSSAQLFRPDEPWYTDVSAMSKASDSDTIVQWLANAGGWGTGTMKIDFSMEVLHADASTPFTKWTPTNDWYSPDCDSDDMPIPPGGALEGETGYTCTTDGDCHLIVIHEPSHKLYEMWRANQSGGTWSGGCLAVWDLQKSYTTTLRGAQCTSADAAGFPIAALLFNADEVAAGHVDHAIRFILPNSRIRHGSYVYPATHATGAASGGASAPPYGVRMRLRADYPVSSLPSAGARVVAAAMQKYGILLADGGNIALTAQSDRFTTAKWDSLLGASDLAALKVQDFDVVDMGSTVPYTGDCVRNP